MPRAQQAYEYSEKGLSVKEIAEKMNIAPSTVHAYIHFGRKPQTYHKKMERRRQRRRSTKFKRRTVYLKDV